MPELKNVVEGPIYRIMMEYVALIRPGDVILSVDGRSVYNSKASDRMIKFADGSDKITLKVFDRSATIDQGRILRGSLSMRRMHVRLNGNGTTGPITETSLRTLTKLSKLPVWLTLVTRSEMGINSGRSAMSTSTINSSESSPRAMIRNSLPTTARQRP